MPQTLAGGIRAFMVAQDRARASETAGFIDCKGPLLTARQGGADEWTVYVPAPRDALVYREDVADPTLGVMRLLPAELGDDAGCDLPHPGLLPLGVTDDVKPETSVAFWSLDDITGWLQSDSSTQPPSKSLSALPRESRTHVSIDPGTGVAREGALYSTSSLIFSDVATTEHPAECAMLCQVASDDSNWLTPDEDVLFHLGGERRLAYMEQVHHEDWPTMATSAFQPTSRLRLLLVTPGLFNAGWIPGWLDRRTLTGAPPAAPDVSLRLISAAVGRRVPVSGWRSARSQGGQRAIRYAVPHGSVYFFESTAGPIAPETQLKLWMSNISDLTQDRGNGYGLVLPGVW